MAMREALWSAAARLARRRFRNAAIGQSGVEPPHSKALRARFCFFPHKIT